MAWFRAFGALMMAGVLAGCAGSGDSCHPKPVALLTTVFAHSVMPIVPATMDGLRVDMMIDTGSQYSSVAQAVATKLNLRVAADKSLVVNGAGGSIFTSVATVRQFSLGASRGSKILLSVLDEGKTRLADGRYFGGLIGNDIMRYYDLDMDLPARQVFLIDTIGCNAIVPWSGALHPVAFDKAGNGAPEVPVLLDGHRMTGVIDTGAAVTLISPYLFRASGIAAEHPKLLATRHGTGVGNERFTTRFYRLHTMTIGGVVMDHPLVAVGGHIQDLNDRIIIGNNFTARHEVYVSNTTGQVFVRP